MESSPSIRLLHCIRTCHFSFTVDQFCLFRVFFLPPPFQFLERALQHFLLAEVIHEYTELADCIQTEPSYGLTPFQISQEMLTGSFLINAGCAEMDHQGHDTSQTLKCSESMDKEYGLFLECACMFSTVSLSLSSPPCDGQRNHNKCAQAG